MNTIEGCCCVGKQNGEPYCPCKMRQLGIFKRNGRWIKPAQAEQDLGAVREGKSYFEDMYNGKHD